MFFQLWLSSVLACPSSVVLCSLIQSIRVKVVDAARGKVCEIADTAASFKADVWKFGIGGNARFWLPPCLEMRNE